MSTTSRLPARRDVLVSVAGLTPQVITETLYCLTCLRKPPADVSEIWVITTVPGKKKVEQTLLDPEHGRFFEFCRDYRLDGDRLRFGPERILVIPGKDGRPLEDIRTAEDSAAAADFILAFVRKLAADPSGVLHCSVAGGRKTMGFYLGLALQLYGRSTDTLLHVLVGPPDLEGDPASTIPRPGGNG
jgi:CRISPR-associated protein (TIGR02584 family)